jgi:DNA-binding transcriptional LysR family regulator
MEGACPSGSELQTELQGADSTVAWVQQGRGAAALDALTVDRYMKDGELARLHRKPVDIRQNVWFVYRRHHREEPALQKVLDIVMDSFELPS